MNITEDYCSYEVAKLLKEKGFNEECSYRYVAEPDYRTPEFVRSPIGKGSRYLYNAPTHQMAMKWLREVHKLHIGIARDPKGYHITIETIPLGVVKYITKEIVGTTYVDSYEKAVEAALKYCLEKIIK